MKQDMIEFLCKAKKNTYAAKGAETIPSRPNSHDLQYEEGNYKYIDTYLGGKNFIGEEAVWEDNQPIWAMNYSGRVIGDEFSGDFLKEALFLVPTEYPYRGPLIYRNEEFTYHCIVSGDPDWYQGYEEIFFMDKKVYECYFHGGKVIQGVRITITIDDKWIMEGLPCNDPKRIKTHHELTDLIDEIGFLPLFKNNIEGFSVEERTASDYWWGGKPEEDPWAWREVIAEEGKVAYGKLFCNKAGFVSKEWYPYLASYRRDGYDFDSRYEDGLASFRTKKIMDVLSLYDQIPSNELKVAAGFGKSGEKGFEGAISLLQLQTYITVRSFRRRRNKKNEEFGWPVALYSLTEKLFGEEYIRSGYPVGAQKAKQMIVERIKLKFPNASEKDIEKMIR